MIFIYLDLNNKYLCVMEITLNANTNTKIFSDSNESGQPLTEALLQPKKETSISWFQMFRFADGQDYAMMIIGTICALLLGGSIPVFILFWGDFTDVFHLGIDFIVQSAFEQLLKFIYLGIGCFFLGTIMLTCWLITGDRQAAACRKKYFATLLQQEIGWYDCSDQSTLSSSFSADTLAFQGALGEKMALMLQSTGTIIGGFIIAFIKGWLMSLVCLAGFPVLGISAVLYFRQLQMSNRDIENIYTQAGGKTEQAFSSIKTVKQLGGQEYEHSMFVGLLETVKDDNMKMGVKIAMAFALMQGTIFLLVALGYWYGSNCVEGNSHCPPSTSQQNYTPGTVLTVFFGLVIGGLFFSQLAPALKKIAQGKEAASRIFQILDRQPQITNPVNGIKPENFSGRITFEKVTFAYPASPKKVILDNLSMQLDLRNTALVGQSGCGKSTILQLIMRFYDPQSGRILLDGYDVKQLDLKWLRSTVGYVGQEPVLFDLSIKENLLLGNERASDKELQRALKQAEAYDFVEELEHKLETKVGAGGGQLSGGQKQRIAIARALLKRPKVMLLDEATSALDRQNEKVIQKTLNRISKGLTTVTVAHRVRTIIAADTIIVLQKGQVKEQGRFDELARYKNYEDVDSEEQDIQNALFRTNLSADGLRNTLRQTAHLDLKIKESLIAIEEKKKEVVEDNKNLVAKYNQGIFGRVFGYLDSHRVSFWFGLLLTLAMGAVYPVFTIFMSTFLNALFDLQHVQTQAIGRADANNASLVFLLLGIGMWACSFVRDMLTHLVGNQVTNKLRSQAYIKMLKMPVYWFDRPANTVGNLTAKLGKDCYLINGMATTYIYIFIQVAATIIAAVVVSFVHEWRTALVAIGSLPLLMAAAAIKAKFRSGLIEKMDKAYQDSAQIVSEALTNIRTVVSFGVQNTVVHRYYRHLQAPQEFLQCQSLISGLFYGLAQTVNFIVFGILFYVGTIFIRDYGVKLVDVFTAIYAIFFAGVTIGNNMTFLPDINEAKLAAAHIFSILDQEDERQLQTRQNSKMLCEGIEGHILFKDVNFRYESRQQQILNKLNLQIKPGQKVAFVGPSGCGKSTIVQLLLRFYMPEEGQITIDGIDIRDYDINYLRSQFGVVSQQPVLFNASFRDNIRYNQLNASEEQIRAAAKEANALTFIEGTEQIASNALHPHQSDTHLVATSGFERSVGLKGSHISGGQKQRVAIARALLRQPKILLLDEATSALDSANQKKVQQSLDLIMKDKTTFSIAHRLETIRNADRINVMQKGTVIQKGNYNQLLQQKGFFYNLKQGTQFV